MGCSLAKADFGSAGTAPDGVANLPFASLAKATRNFPEKSVIGTGPRGKVYKGVLYGADVAVKKLLANTVKDNFMREVELWKQLKHENLVQLVAYCCHPKQFALALEFAPLGSLFDLLHGEGGKVLKWEERLSVLLGAAQGLQFVHSLPHGEDGLVHGNIKSSNILVFEGPIGKLADCKLQQDTQASVVIDSTLPTDNITYEAPEAFNGEFTQKSDVYSFGVVILEALTGRKSTDSFTFSTAPGKLQMKQWALNYIQKQPEDKRAIVDPKIQPSELSDKHLKKICEVANRCLDPESSRRPDISQIVKYIQASTRQGLNSALSE